MDRTIVWILALCAMTSEVVAKLHSSDKHGPMTNVTNSTDLEHEHNPQIHLAFWNWHEVGIFLTITIFLLVSGNLKVMFHKMHWLSSRIPESCLLILVGVSFGAILEKTEYQSGVFTFTPHLFFFALLPPIILEAAYSLYDKAFFDNLPTILIMAVFGTFINFLLIGFLLYAVQSIGAMGVIRTSPSAHDEVILSLWEILLFAALISAVDPVAVLAIFQEVGVNPDLYFLVFGESLLNDGVAVVFYKTISAFVQMSNHKNSTTGEPDPIDITADQYVLAFLSFFTIALGGLMIGIIVGLISALMTRTTKDVHIMEPLILLGTGYLAYMGAELFHWSGIISLIGCGLIQAHYSFKNVDRKSITTVHVFIKMASAASDIIIFLFLGMALIKQNNENTGYWHTGFVVWSIAFCLICRFISVYGLTWIANKHRVKIINLQEQFIMAYGGLRGAVGFSLVKMISENDVDDGTRRLFVTTTLVVVTFTIFFQGMTIKPLVNLLNIEKKKDEQKLITEEVNDTVLDHIMSGVDVISGKRGKQYFQNWLEHIDENYLKPIFCNPNTENAMVSLFEDLALSDHYLNLYGPLVTQDDYVKKDPKSIDPEPTAPLIEPPALPPRQDRPSIMGRISFRRSQRLGSDGTVKLEVPQDSLQRRPSQKEEIHLVRRALKNNSTRRIIGRHQMEDGLSLKDTNVYNRHLSARRISHLMLMGQQGGEGVGGNVEPKSTGQFHRDEADDVLYSKLQRLGSETVLRRYNEKRRTLSAASSDYDPTYSNLNEMRGGINITRTNPMAEVQQTDNVEVESTSSTTTRPTITTATSPVERKKMTGSTGGRRKLTPHPLNPNNASTAVGSQAENTTADSKLAVLAESEDPTDGNVKRDE